MVPECGAADGVRAHLCLRIATGVEEGLLKRCDDIHLTPGAMAIEGNTAFVEWEMALKIPGITCVYPGTSWLQLNREGRICDHRDTFDFEGPTFGAGSPLGGFLRWLDGRFMG